MPKTFSTADKLFVETANAVAGLPTQTAHGFVARLESVDHCFTWNKGFNMDIVKACGDLLFLLSFSHDGKQAKTYNPEVATDEGLVPNAYGPQLRDQLATLVATLSQSLYDSSAVLCAWNGIEDQQNAFFHPGDDSVRPNDLLTAQFLYDGQRLHVIANFRVVDVFELPYIVFTWSRMLSMVSAMAGVIPGTVQFQSGVIHLNDRVVSDEVASGGWFDREPPLKLCDSPWPEWARGDPLEPFDNAAVSEELMRRDFKFKEHRDDLARFAPFSTLATCLSVVYLRASCKVLPKLFTSASLVRGKGGKRVFGELLDDMCDERLSDRVLSRLWQDQPVPPKC